MDDCFTLWKLITQKINALVEPAQEKLKYKLLCKKVKCMTLFLCTKNST